MKIRNTLSRRRSDQRARGFTFIEMMVAVGVGSIVLLVLSTVFLSSNRMFIDLSNYVGIDQDSEHSLERMTRDIRKSQDMLSFDTNRIEFVYDATRKLSFTYDPVARQLTRSLTGEPDVCLMKDCDYLEFSMCKNAPKAGGTVSQTIVPGLAKGIMVNWKCSRTVLNQTHQSETVEQALIVIRNKPVL